MVDVFQLIIPVLALAFAAFTLGVRYGTRWERIDRFDRDAVSQGCN